MFTPRDALQALQAMAADGRLDTFCDAQGIDLVVAFGSAVDPGWPAPPRDLDLAVLAVEPSSDWGWAGLVSAFMELLHYDDVDVLNLRTAGVLARAEALGNGLPLYERRPGLFAQEQMRAVGQRMESGWLTRLQLETLAAR